MADPAMRQALSYAIDKNEINTRLLGGTVQVANTNISPGAWFFADQTAGDVRSGEGQVDPRRGRLDVGADGIREKDGLKAKIELCTTTRQVRQDTLALVSDWLKDVGIEAVVERRSTPTNIFANYNEATADTPCALSKSNFDLAEHAFSCSIDPLGNYFNYHSQPVRAGWRERCPGQGHRTSTRSSTPSRTRVDFAVIKDAMADVPEGLRREDGRGPAVLPQEGRPRRPEGRQLLREPDPGRPDLERRRLVRQGLAPSLMPSGVGA